MNIQKFTQNSLQAVQGCEKVAYEYGNQEIEQEHLLYALITQEDSLIIKLLEKMNIQKELFMKELRRKSHHGFCHTDCSVLALCRLAWLVLCGLIKEAYPIVVLLFDCDCVVFMEYLIDIHQFIVYESFYA